MRKALTLYELNHLVTKLVAQAMPAGYWVQAELSEANERGGHCYMELVEKAPDMSTPVARASAKCWRTRWSVLGPAFEQATGQRMHAGIKVLLLVHAQFHEAYGFSWIVDDIDPTYTLGDMARQRQEIVRQLKVEGVFDLQKQLELPLFCQRVAVVSAATAAGYGDFCNQLTANDRGLRFHTELFEATMQGERVEATVIDALNRINRRLDEFDVVVIIRGGGGKADLSGFDTLLLAENVANFPLPVITGIGHDRDESVADMVSFMRVKTPTAAATLLVDHLAAVYDRVEDSRRRIVASVERRMEREGGRLERVTRRMPAAFGMTRARREAAVDRLWARLLSALRGGMAARKHRVEMAQARLEALDPQRVLQRGYSITLHGGRAVRDAATLRPGDVIVTRVAKGRVESVVAPGKDMKK